MELRACCQMCGLAGPERSSGSGLTMRASKSMARGWGRIRDIVTGPDGYLYLALHLSGPSVTTNTPGKIVRLTPAEQ